MSQVDVRPAPIEHPGPDPKGRSVDQWTVGRLARVATMLFVAAIFVFPIVGFIAMAFRSERGVDTGAGGFLGLGDVSWGNVVHNWSQVNGFGPNGGLFTQWILNSLFVAGGGALLGLVAALPAGYAMARLRFRFRRSS